MGKVTNRALEEIAPLYPVVQRILSFREKGQDLGSLRQMADRIEFILYGVKRDPPLHEYTPAILLFKISVGTCGICLLPLPVMCLSKPIIHRRK